MTSAQNYIILSEKEWNSNLVKNLEKEFPDETWIHITSKKDFNFQNLDEIKPKKIFIPHWSHIVPKEIYENFECIVFHMTDLPFGRGGSPLQNLIVRGYKNTKISALQVDKEIDAGPIYLKSDLSLEGSAKAIFKRCNIIIQKMICQIINEHPVPKAQVGEVVHFKRRKPEQGNIQDLDTIQEIYNHIRMLDADGYPSAFLEFGDFKLEFSGASIKSDNTLLANVRIIKR